MEWKYDPMEERYDPMKWKYDRMEERYDPMEWKYDRMEERYDPMEWKYDPMEERYDPMEWKYDPVEHGYDPMECKGRLDCIFVQNALPYKVMCFPYLILRSDVLMFRIPDISQCVNNYFETEKS